MIEYENLAAVNRSFEAELINSFAEVVKSGHFVLGRNVQEFESEFAKYCQSSYGIGVASGLDALLLSLRALEIEAGSEVIVPSNTYIATVLAVYLAGLKPVLVEPEIDSYNLCPENLKKAITSKTKAVIVVHLYGRSCTMDKISDLCAHHQIHLLEDCAQSHGARYKGQMTGTFGTGCFSFYPTKNLGALGDAGAILTRDLALNSRLRGLRNYGSEKKYYNTQIGYNSRLDEVQAAFLRIKLRKLNELNSHKKNLAEIYHSELKGKFILPLPADENHDHVYHIFNIRHPDRDRLRDYLIENGVKTEIHYPVPPHNQEAYKRFFEGQRFPISEEIHKTTLSLPISFCHHESDVQKVCALLKKF